jgi:general stress protein 26
MAATPGVAIPPGAIAFIQILSSNQASFTIYDEKKLQTVQLNGTVEIETNQEIMNFVHDELSKPRSYEDGIKYPPVTKIHEGMFIIIKITPNKIKYLDFNLI